MVMLVITWLCRSSTLNKIHKKLIVQKIYYYNFSRLKWIGKPDTVPNKPMLPGGSILLRVPGLQELMIAGKPIPEFPDQGVPSGYCHSDQPHRPAKWVKTVVVRQHQ